MIRQSIYCREHLYLKSEQRERLFCYNEIEKLILSVIKGNYTIQRSKGLGENDPDMMWETTMNPETRRLIQVLPDNIELTQKIFDILLGDNLNERKNYISEFGYLYMDDMDVI